MWLVPLRSTEGFVQNITFRDFPKLCNTLRKRKVHRGEPHIYTSLQQTWLCIEITNILLNTAEKTDQAEITPCLTKKYPVYDQVFGVSL